MLWVGVIYETSMVLGITLSIIKDTAGATTHVKSLVIRYFFIFSLHSSEIAIICI